MMHDWTLLVHLLEAAPDLADLATAYVLNATPLAAEACCKQLDPETLRLYTTLADIVNVPNWCSWGHSTV